ncbi:MAG: methyl-accepting chemotaxis protein [Deltaproteobacteria bacterium]|nr:methyl-accepting chemotaxis protein [Deltaproteobacteria bacterium]
MKNNRRKLNLSVKRQFQLWLLTRILGVVLLSALVAVLILYFYSRQEISSSFYSAHIKIRRVSDLLLPVMAAGALVSLLSGMALALFLPQKIAGPIFRIEQGLKSVREGDLTQQIRLRRNDTLMDLAAVLNETTGCLRTRIHEVKDLQRELDRLVASLEHQEAAAISARQNAVLDGFRT